MKEIHQNPPRTDHIICRTDEVPRGRDVVVPVQHNPAFRALEAVKVEPLVLHLEASLSDGLLAGGTFIEGGLSAVIVTQISVTEMKPTLTLREAVQTTYNLQSRSSSGTSPRVRNNSNVGLGKNSQTNSRMNKLPLWDQPQRSKMDPI